MVEPNHAEIIGADREVKHFVGSRRYTPFDVSVDSIKSAFDRDIRHSQSGYFDGLRIFSVIFPLMIAISIYVMIAALPENRLGLIAIPLIAFGLGIFTINSELKLDSVYSAARENAVISHAFDLGNRYGKRGNRNRVVEKNCELEQPARKNIGAYR